jgi:hypothetical protein
MGVECVTTQYASVRLDGEALRVSKSSLAPTPATIAVSVTMVNASVQLVIKATIARLK